MGAIWATCSWNGSGCPHRSEPTRCSTASLRMDAPGLCFRNSATMPIHTDLSAPRAPQNHIPPRHDATTTRNAGNRLVPGSPPPLLLKDGRRSVPGPPPPDLGSVGTHVLGPATERLLLGMTTSRSCEGMQHRLHPLPVCACICLLWTSLATQAALHLLPPYFPT